MAARSTLLTVLRVSATMLAVTALLAGAPSIAGAQSLRTAGSIGVSLTILQPVTTQPVRIVGFDVDRNGVATVQTTAPASAPVSQIVMANLVRENTDASASTGTPSTSTMVASPALRYVVDLGAPRTVVARAPVQLRLQYLTVAGT